MATKTLAQANADLVALEKQIAAARQAVADAKDAELAGHKQKVADMRAQHVVDAAALAKKQKEELEKYAADVGLSLTDLGLRSARGTAGKKPAPKRTRLPDSAKPYLSGVTYNHPNPGPGDKKTYVGGSRGRVPGWLLDEVKKNGNADALAVKDAAFAAMSKVRANEQKARGSV